MDCRPYAEIREQNNIGHALKPYNQMRQLCEKYIRSYDFKFASTYTNQELVRLYNGKCKRAVAYSYITVMMYAL